ncbi:NUDIX hydrolase [Silvimonas soli]|uniref:NUDIX hydrolase n=1 Tax=Silvimonas soli TaxID=2980100 RepID=UPI0024B3947F|nr:DUF4743 domain-containing protein [Silvimonas soli]
MSLRAHLESYLATQPRFNPAGLLRLQVLGLDLGWVEPQTVTFLQAHSPAFVVAEQRLLVSAADPAMASAVLTDAAVAMRANGLIKGWRDELYTVLAPASDGTPDVAQPLFQLERGAFRRFGMTSLAVHINGWRADGQLWIGQRAASKAVDPDRLDNIAAGGMSAGENAFECAVRELWEEAGVPAALASTAIATSEIRTCRNEIDGTHDEILYCYDLAVPDGFTPHNTDGEVAGFQLLDASAIVANLTRFTWDAGLVTADFLLRTNHV